MHSPYPTVPRDRNRWILSRRQARRAVDPHKPSAFLVEQERTASGDVVSVATIFLTNRECPWRCLMCDLWKNTLTETVPVGAIPAQIDFALSRLAPGGTISTAALPPSAPDERETLDAPRENRAGGAGDPVPVIEQIKLYNSGSFFDPRAIPPEDYPAIAEQVCAFERVIVECHPALVGERCLRFRDLLETKASGLSVPFPTHSRMEVALGLETAHPEVLEKLNKRMTLDQFSKAAAFLKQNRIALRAFVLVRPPFLDEAQALHWAQRSIDFAFDCGAAVVSLIPTRLGNGALEALARSGDFAEPKLATLEAALEYGIDLQRGRVFADLWDLERFAECRTCFPARAARLRQMNLRQEVLPKIERGCGAAEP